MKNLLFLLVFFCGLGTVQSQKITMDLQEFSGVMVTNGLRVELIASNENRAEITGQSRDQIELNVSGGVLNIRYTLSNIWKEDNTRINVYFKELGRLEARQKSEVKISSNFKHKDVEFRVQEGAIVKVASMNVDNMYASIVTGGRLDAYGKAQQQEITVKTAGEFLGENLEGKRISVDVTSTGKANVYASEYVDAKVKAGGQIFIYGNPQTVDQQVKFGGTIQKIN